MPVSERNRRIFEECAASDEPCIVFRAKDYIAPDVLNFYKQEAQQDGCAPEFIEAVESHLGKFIDWQKANPDKVKHPDLREGEQIA